MIEKEENVKNKSLKEIWYGKEFENFRRLILQGNITESCSNFVSTHIPINKEIREEIKKFILF